MYAVAGDTYDVFNAHNTPPHDKIGIPIRGSAFIQMQFFRYVQVAVCVVICICVDNYLSCYSLLAVRKGETVLLSMVIGYCYSTSKLQH
jgi:hypothetical protein